MCIFFFNPKPGKFFIRVFEIGIKLLARHEQAVTIRPVAIQQMFVGVGAEVMTVLSKLLYQFVKCRIPVKITCKKERRFYGFFLSSRVI